MRKGALILFSITLHFSVCAAVLPPNSIIEGKPIGEWIVEGDKRWMQLSTNVHPDFDVSGGSRLASHQSGPIFGLPTGLGTRSWRVAVPSGKHILIPVAPIGSDPFEAERFKNDVAGLRDFIYGITDHLVEAYLKIDGVPVPNIMSHRETTPVFSHELINPDNMWSYYMQKPMTGTITPFVISGIFVVVEPMLPGRYVFEYHKRYDASAGFLTGHMEMTVYVTARNEPLLYGPFLSGKDPAKLTITGEVGRTCVILASSDFKNWQPIVTHKITASPFDVFDSGAAQSPQRFYRAQYSP